MGKEQITVELVDHMGSDLSTVDSARVSFNKTSEYVDGKDQAGIDLINSMLRDIESRNDWYEPDYVSGELKEGDKKLIKYLADHRHMTPFRHNGIQLRCSAPIFLIRQLGKHQVGMSWNEVSRRYVDTPPEMFVPDEWRGRPDGSIKQGSGGNISMWSQSKNKADYANLCRYSLEVYHQMIDEGIAPEMARMVLPQSMMTEWIWSGNLLSFAHVYKERKASGAQLEAQWFADMLDQQIRPLFPISWAALVD